VSFGLIFAGVGLLAGARTAQKSESYQAHFRSKTPALYGVPNGVLTAVWSSVVFCPRPITPS